MSGMNVQISLTGLSQVDRHQNDIHRTPVIHQDQNAAIMQADAHKRMSMPVEPDAAEKKSVDPDDRRRESGKRRKKRTSSAKKEIPPDLTRDHDHLIDLQV